LQYTNTYIPEQRFPDDRHESDGQKDERERHGQRVGQLNAQRGRVPASVNYRTVVWLLTHVERSKTVKVYSRAETHWSGLREKCQRSFSRASYGPAVTESGLSGVGRGERQVPGTYGCERPAVLSV